MLEVMVVVVLVAGALAFKLRRGSSVRKHRRDG
jgi:hypothetical protein